MADTQMAPQPTTEVTPLRLWAITLLMGLAQLVITSDFSIVSVALPSIGRSLGTEPALLSWVVSAHSVVFAGFLIIGGRLTDAFGHRRCLTWGLVLFAAGSLLSGLSLNIWTLIAARCLQGLGAALISPASFSLIHGFLPEGPARHRALGVFAIMQGLSVIIGLLLGGWLTTQLGWRAVFFVNLPIVAACLGLTAAVLPRTAPATGAGALDDLGGAVLIAGSTGLLLSALSNLGEHGLASPLGAGLLVAAIAGFGLFVRRQARHPSPLMPLSIFRTENLPGAALALMALIAGFGGYFVLTSLYLQNGLRFSAAIAGLGMTPIALATIAAGPCAPFLMKRLSLRTLAIAGLSLQLCGLIGLALAAPLGQYIPVVALAFPAVFGSTSAFVALMGLALNKVPARSQGAASGLLFTAQQIGLPAGVVITLALFALLPGADGALAAYGRAYLAPAGIVALGLAALLLLPWPGGVSQPRAPSD
jgi:MFS family permease